MQQLGKVLTQTSWAQASNTINNNSDKLFNAITMLENASVKMKGYFMSVEDLTSAYPNSEEGSQAFVYNSTNPSTAQYDIYKWTNGKWVDSGANGGGINIDLSQKQDVLQGYTENVTNGNVTQIGIQGNVISLTGRVAIGELQDVEQTISNVKNITDEALVSVNNVGADVYNLMNPIKPIHINPRGSLELNLGQGLYVSDGKLCAYETSGGGGSGIYSEGQGIKIVNNSISVAYNVETIAIDSCGGLTVNFGEGLGISDGKLIAKPQAIAGKGISKSGSVITLSVGTGLILDDEVYVAIGKGLARDNTNHINVKLDENTITTLSDGKLTVNKDGLIGNGLKNESSKIAINYGTGLDIKCGKLYSTVQDGNSYSAGLGIVIDSSNKIRVSDSILSLSTRVYELGDFASSGDAEQAAQQPTISGSDEIVLMRYTVSSSKKQGIFLQQVGDYRTTQYQFWDGAIYTRYVWFTDNTRDVLNNGLNAGEKWWKLGATHTNYDSTTHKIHLANKDDNNINPNDSAEIPIVSSSVAGLMSSDMLQTLNCSQTKLQTYKEIISGSVTSVGIDANLVSISGETLSLHDVTKVCGALFYGLQTRGNININAKSTIASNIDSGELKVLHGASNYGFILRTVDNPKDPEGLMLAELLSTDGYDSYNYTFPAKSGEVALKSDIPESPSELTFCGGLTQDGSSVSVCSGIMDAIDGLTPYEAGCGISISDNKINISLKYDGGGLEFHDGSLTIATGDGLSIDKCGQLYVNATSGLTFNSGELQVALHPNGGLGVVDCGISVNTGAALGVDENQLQVLIGEGLKTDSCNNLIVDIGTGLQMYCGEVCLNYSTSYFTITNNAIDLNIDALRYALGLPSINPSNNE